MTRCEGRALSIAYKASPKLFAEISKQLGWVFRWSARLCSEYRFAPVRTMIVEKKYQGIVLSHAYTASLKIFVEVSRQGERALRWLAKICGECNLPNGGKHDYLMVREGNALSAAYKAYPGIYAELSKRLDGLLQQTTKLCGECGFAMVNNETA